MSLYRPLFCLLAPEGDAAAASVPSPMWFFTLQLHNHYRSLYTFIVIIGHCIVLALPLTVEGQCFRMIGLDTWSSLSSILLTATGHCIPGLFTVLVMVFGNLSLMVFGNLSLMFISIQLIYLFF